MSTATLTTLAEIEDRLGEKTGQEVRRAANILVQRQFLFAGDRGGTHAYAALASARFRRYFEILFDSLGYRFLVSEGEQWVGLLPDPDLDLTPRLRLEDTLVLLVLAHVWQEEVQRGGAEARAVVVTTVNDLFERYRDLAGRHRKEGLSPARLLDVLRDFARRGLVGIGAFDPEADDYQLDIRPMINRLMDGAAITRLERFTPELEGRIAKAREEVSEEESGEQTSDEPDPNSDDTSLFTEPAQDLS